MTILTIISARKTKSDGSWHEDFVGEALCFRTI